MVTTIEDPIQVCAHFKEGRVFPLWFIWRGRFYKISAVTSRWATPEGRARRHHFSVLCAETCELYEIYYHSEQLIWRLGRIASEG